MTANRQTGLFAALAAAFGREAAGTGLFPLVAVSAALVYLSPAMALFTLGNRAAARWEAACGSLIGLVAFASTLTAVLLARGLREERVLELLATGGVPAGTVAVALSSALFLAACWTVLALVLAALAALSEGGRWWAALLLLAAGFLAPRAAVGGFFYSEDRRWRRLERALSAGLAGAWLLAAAALVLGAWGADGARMLLALLSTAAWGVLFGLGLGAVLAVPQALAVAAVLWVGWSAAGPALEWLTGGAAAPRLPWGALMAWRRGTGTGGWLPWLLLQAASAWLLAGSLSPVFLAAGGGEGR